MVKENHSIMHVHFLKQNGVVNLMSGLKLIPAKFFG